MATKKTVQAKSDLDLDDYPIEYSFSFTVEKQVYLLPGVQDLPASVVYKISTADEQNVINVFSDFLKMYVKDNVVDKLTLKQLTALIEGYMAGANPKA